MRILLVRLPPIPGSPAIKTSRRLRDVIESIQSAIAFQMQTQFHPESVLYLRDPERALGGFHRSLTIFEIRIDYVQHNISSLLCAHRLLGNNSTVSVQSPAIGACRTVWDNV